MPSDPEREPERRTLASRLAVQSVAPAPWRPTLRRPRQYGAAQRSATPASPATRFPASMFARRRLDISFTSTRDTPAEACEDSCQPCSAPAVLGTPATSDGACASPPPHLLFGLHAAWPTSRPLRPGP